MNIMKKSSLVFLIFLIIISSSYAVSISFTTSSDSPLKTYYFEGNSSSELFNIDFTYSFREDISEFETFTLEAQYENNSLGKVCVRVLSSQKDQTFSCGISNKGNGSYILRAQLRDTEDNILLEDTIFESIYSSHKMNFISQEEKTQITLSIDEGENILVHQIIPKEVIALLTPENRDSLIFSEKPYIIVEEDPVIAWHVEKAPEEIRYTINKSITSDEMRAFAIEIQEQSSNSFLKYGIIGLLVVIIILIFYQAMSKK